jgi:hypothetical protein
MMLFKDNIKLIGMRNKIQNIIRPVLLMSIVNLKYKGP